MTARVVIADATPFARLAARMALVAEGVTVEAEVGTAAEALRETVTSQADVLLLDEDLDGEMDVVRRVSVAAPDTAVIVMSAGASEVTALTAVRAGACGFLPKDTPPERLAAIVLGVLDGEAAIPRRVVRRLLAGLRDRQAASERRELSARERQVLGLLAQGLPDRLVGERLGVSEVTVRRHAGAAIHKLQASGRQQAIERFAFVVDAASRPLSGDPGETPA